MTRANAHTNRLAIISRRSPSRVTRPIRAIARPSLVTQTGCVALTAHTPNITKATVIANQPHKSTYLIIIIKRVITTSCYTQGEGSEGI